MRKWMCLLVVSATLSGCATRGTLDSNCANLALKRLDQSRLVRDIQSGAPLDADSFIAVTVDVDPPRLNGNAQVGPLSLAETLRNAAASPSGEARDSLLLSGGGQWGAYGAGLIAALEQGGKLPRFATVTGVSTGALQALFVGALGDPALQGEDAQGNRMEILRKLMESYRPATEKEVVNRHSRKELAVVTGSFAGLSPLRQRIHARLCDDAWKPTDCPVIRYLARSKTRVFVGFVQAHDGNFYYSDINAIALGAYPEGRSTPPSSEDLANAQRCIAGATLGSVAMPVFFQQVRVGPPGGEVTYYDGGVRQSVFEANIAGEMQRAYTAALSLKNAEMQARNIDGEPSIEAPTLYVIRNGPTVLIRRSSDPDFNAKRNAIDAAMRAETILVNQLEVQSIADLRLAHPTGTILLRTADGFGVKHRQPGDDAYLPSLPYYRGDAGEEPGCEKVPEEAMFSPSFMACIMRYGRQHGKEASWITLSPLRLEPKEPGE